VIKATSMRPYPDRDNFNLVKNKRFYGKITSISYMSRNGFASYYDPDQRGYRSLCFAFAEITNGIMPVELECGTEISFTLGRHKNTDVIAGFDVWPQVSQRQDQRKHRVAGTRHHSRGVGRVGFRAQDYQNDWPGYSRPINRNRYSFVPKAGHQLLKRREMENEQEKE
jgi:hypothetical protein